jgi:alpha-tubulin suppressor-like RCC1 family protein
MSEDIACAIVDGSAWCWGKSNSSYILDGNPPSDPLVPVPIAGLESDVVSLAVEHGHACAVRAGQVWCWGGSLHGELGMRDSFGPVSIPVAGIAGEATMVAVGFDFSCAVAGGAVQCWGNDSDGQLGSEDFGSSPGIKEVRFPK